MKIIKFPIDEFLLRNTGMALDSLRAAGVPVAGKTELQGVESGRLVCYNERGMRVFEYHPEVAAVAAPVSPAVPADFWA